MHEGHCHCPSSSALVSSVLVSLVSLVPYKVVKIVTKGSTYQFINPRFRHLFTAPAMSGLVSIGLVWDTCSSLNQFLLPDLLLPDLLLPILVPRPGARVTQEWGWESRVWGEIQRKISVVHQGQVEIVGRQLNVHYTCIDFEASSFSSSKWKGEGSLPIHPPIISNTS